MSFLHMIYVMIGKSQKSKVKSMSCASEGSQVKRQKAKIESSCNELKTANAGK
jgi:hypothetical protein